MSGDPIVLDTKKIQVAFTRGIDTKKTQITVTNSKTKKVATIDRLENDPEDLRVVYIMLKKDIEKDVPYDITFKKVTTQAGSELPAEQRTTLKVVYGDAGTVPLVPPPAPGQNPLDTAASDKEITEPVPIDQLPKTGPGMLIVLFMSILFAFWIQKKLSKRA